MSAAPTILVVEDDRDVRGLVELVLSTAGFTVVTAGDGLEGLLKLRLHRPATVVLDIMMPDVGGLRVLDQIAEEEPGVAVVVVTGKPEAAQVARDRLGRENVFDKPFDVDQLVARVRALTPVREDVTREDVQPAREDAQREDAQLHSPRPHLNEEEPG